MRTYLLTFVLLLACTAALASPVTVGIESKGNPGQAQICAGFTAGIDDLGTGDFADLVTGAKIQELKDPTSGTTLLSLDATNVPATLCTSEGVAVTVATAACTGALTMYGLRPINGGDGVLAGWLWKCAKLNNLGDPFWVFAKCP